MNRAAGARPFRPGLLLYLTLLFAVILFGDWFIDLRPGPIFGRGVRVLPILVRLADTPIHALVALAVTAPLLAVLPGRSRWAGGLFVLALGFGLDVDHFVAAHSLSLVRIMYLPERPPTHSLTFAAAAGSLAGLLGLLAGYYRRSASGPSSLPRRFPYSPAGASAVTLAWLAFAALASHVLRDAPSGAAILWPLPYGFLPTALYYHGELDLCVISYWLARSGLLRWS